MNLSKEEEKVIREYIASVDRIVSKYVPKTVPGETEFFNMVQYLERRERLLNLLSPTEKRTKWKQVDLEEAIANEKKGK